MFCQLRHSHPCFIIIVMLSSLYTYIVLILIVVLFFGNIWHVHKVIRIQASLSLLFSADSRNEARCGAL